MTAPAALRTATGIGKFVRKVRAVLDAVTQTLRLGESQSAQTCGALGGLVRGVSTLRDSVAPVSLAHAEVVVTAPGGWRTETVVRVVLLGGTDWQRGGRDVWTVQFLLPLLAVPLSVTHLVLTDAGTQPTSEKGIVNFKNYLLFLTRNWTVLT